ncbi:hypothetical protein GGTG_05231 [Gaeumannomyces tritici R3-111a-1]|uniref:Uncharacterized protein n=1 Tax=Gaeumannomyces tritici (strain R3-111a-1) TaxID=644352 RepID=J3NVB8_GAET3|nr:hypothetical protein GGTG_05231 [Gaeumannomyces tritici R3-111a-1]EJT75294.1 hypothetical protein GGTG_05231 [Gaeumannomyces tritici R3-111a-1]
MTFCNHRMRPESPYDTLDRRRGAQSLPWLFVPPTQVSSPWPANVSDSCMPRCPSCRQWAPLLQCRSSAATVAPVPVDREAEGAMVVPKSAQLVADGTRRGNDSTPQLALLLEAASACCGLGCARTEWDGDRPFVVAVVSPENGPGHRRNHLA